MLSRRETLTRQSMDGLVYREISDEYLDGDERCENDGHAVRILRQNVQNWYIATLDRH
jgi:hypothetical protein